MILNIGILESKKKKKQNFYKFISKENNKRGAVEHSWQIKNYLLCIGMWLNSCIQWHDRKINTRS